MSTVPVLNASWAYSMVNKSAFSDWGFVEHHANVYLTHLSDGATFYRNFTAEKLLLALRVNLLFFDHVAVNVVSLIGNPQVSELMRTDTSAMQHLYKVGAIVPVMRYQSESREDTLLEVADRMRKSNTAAGMNYENYSHHATQISDSLPTLLWIDDYLYKTLSTSMLVRLIDSNPSYGDHQLSPDERAKASGMARLLFRDAELNSISKFNSFADSNFSTASSHNMKVFSETAIQCAYSHLIGSRVSFPEEASKLLSSVGRDKLSVATKNDQSVVETAINMDVLMSLSISELIEIRDTAPFTKIRMDMTRLRSGHLIDISNLRTDFDHCVQILNKFVETKKGDRGALLQRLQQHEHKRMMRAVIGFMSNGTLLLELGLYLIGRNIGTFSLALAAGFALAETVLPEGNMLVESNSPSDALYRPQDGEIIQIS